VGGWPFAPWTSGTRLREEPGTVARKYRGEGVRGFMGRPDARDLCAAEAGAGAGLSGIVTSRTRRSRRCTVAQGGPRDLHRGAASQGLPRHATARARHPLAVWLKEMEEEEERKRGQPLDNSIEIQLDSCPEYVK
jgi:hypothetical protein